jgi:hypothetical protein
MLSISSGRKPCRGTGTSLTQGWWEKNVRAVKLNHNTVLIPFLALFDIQLNLVKGKE